MEVTIQSSPEHLEELIEKLDVLGFDSLVIDDEADFRQFLEQNTAYWDYVDETLAAQMRGKSQVRLYLEQDARTQQRLAQLRDGLAGLDGIRLHAAQLEEENWAESWQKNYPPLPVGKRLLVVPCWQDAFENPEQRILVRLDPGLAFGTGAHESTQLCMQMLENVIHGGERVADLGCGSGILSLSALLLGAGSAIGVDIDPKAADSARQNAALNGLDERFSACAGNVLHDRGLMERLSGEGYDIVVANIVADVIIQLAPLAPRLMCSSGIFLCSGIVSERADEVRAALLAVGLRIKEQLHENGWTAFAAVRA